MEEIMLKVYGLHPILLFPWSRHKQTPPMVFRHRNLIWNQRCNTRDLLLFRYLGLPIHKVFKCHCLSLVIVNPMFSL